MTLTELKNRWEVRREECARFDAYVSAAKLIDELLSDLAQAVVEEPDVELTLSQAAEVSGYSADHLGRLVRDGRLTNVGRSRAPRVRRRDLPRKLAPPSPVSVETACATVGSHVPSPSQIARSLVTGNRRTR